jgi:SnoaL-like polyketide cyclase
MSAADNKALVRRFLAARWEQRPPAAVDTGRAPHDQRPLSPRPPPLPHEGVTSRLARVSAAFPDTQGTIADMVAAGDRVVIRVTLRAIHRGVFQGLAPTGTHVMVSLVEMLRLDGGHIVESWGGLALGDVLHPLGAVVSVDPDVP